MEKQIIGSVESVKIGGEEIMAKIDTGAARSSIDLKLAKRLGLTEDLWDIKKIKAANGSEYRPIIKTRIQLGKLNIQTTFTVTKRDGMEYPMLIGKNLLKQGFLVDVAR